MEIIIRDNEMEVDKKFDVTTKEGFISMANALYDMMNEKLTECVKKEDVRKEVEEEIYDDILSHTEFTEKEDLIKWLDETRRCDYDIQYVGFDGDDLRDKLIKDACESEGYDNIDEMVDVIENMRSALDDIYYTAMEWRR